MKYSVFTVGILLNVAVCYASQPADHPLSTLIAETFLKGATKKVNSSSDFKEDISGKELFYQFVEKDNGIDDSDYKHLKVETSEIRMTIQRDTSSSTDQVIITTVVFGSIDDFNYTNILNNQKDLLKYRLLKSYMDRKEKLPTFEGRTKTVKEPHFITIITKFPHGKFTASGYVKEESEVSKDRKAIVFETYFNFKEFDALVDATCEFKREKSFFSTSETQDGHPLTAKPMLFVYGLIMGAFAYRLYVKKSLEKEGCETVHFKNAAF